MCAHGTVTVAGWVLTGGVVSCRVASRWLAAAYTKYLPHFRNTRKSFTDASKTRFAKSKFNKAVSVQWLLLHYCDRRPVTYPFLKCVPNILDIGYIFAFSDFLRFHLKILNLRRVNTFEGSK